MGLLPTPNDPIVVQVMRGFKAQLLQLEAAQMQQMAARWLGVELALEANISALADEVARMKAAGIEPSAARIYRLERAQRLLAQSEAQFTLYADYATDLITRQQAELQRMALRNAAQAIDAAYLPRVGVYFDRLPVAAIEYMVGIAGDGNPLGELLKLRMVRDADGNPLPGVWDKLVEALVNGTAQGRNPRQVAREMQDLLTAGLQKALVIARTEQLRVYRMTSAAAYERSGVVTGQKRLAAHDDRVCAACIADEGHIYPINQPIPDHPQGRCTGVPVLKDFPQVQWLSGEAWFKQQDAATQRAILGQGRLAAWQNGDFAFSDLVRRTRNTTWGPGLQPRPLNQLIEAQINGS